MDTVTVVHIKGFNPTIEIWEETEITSGRCIVSFHWTDNTSDQNTREITITFTRSQTQMNRHLVSCIKASDGAHLITNSDILGICLAISPVGGRDEELLKRTWRDNKRGDTKRHSIPKSDEPLYKRLKDYKYPSVGNHRRSVFICSDWCDKNIQEDLFTWLDIVREYDIAHSNAHAPGTTQQPSPGLSSAGEQSETEGQLDTGGPLSEGGVPVQRRDVRSIHALLNAGGPQQ